MISYDIMNVFSKWNKKQLKQKIRVSVYILCLLFDILFKCFFSNLFTSVFTHFHVRPITDLPVHFLKILVLSLVGASSTQLINSLPMTASHTAPLLNHRQLTFIKIANFPLSLLSVLLLCCSCVISIDTMGCLGNTIINCNFMSFTEREAEQRHIFGWIMRNLWYKIIEQKDEKRKKFRFTHFG